MVGNCVHHVKHVTPNSMLDFPLILRVNWPVEFSQKVTSLGVENKATDDSELNDSPDIYFVSENPLLFFWYCSLENKTNLL